MALVFARGHELSLAEEKWGIAITCLGEKGEILVGDGLPGSFFT